MADVSKIKLPDNTEVNIKDSRILGIDSTPTPQSENPVTSTGIFNYVNPLFDVVNPPTEYDPSLLTKRSYTILDTNLYGSNSAYKHVLIPVNSGDKVTVTSNASNRAQIAWFTSDETPTAGGTPPFVSGTGKIFAKSANSTESFIAPNGANFLYVYLGISTSDYSYTPTSVSVVGTTTIDVDSVPTSGSNKLVRSGGVYTALGSYSPCYQYGITDSSEYLWVKINNTNAWAGSFTVKVYVSYHFEIYEIGGYNYASQTGWYGPRARLLASTARDSVDIILGYTSAQELWFAIPTISTASGQPKRVLICDYNGSWLKENVDFTCTTVSSVDDLDGTTQSTLTLTQPVTTDTAQTISGAKTFSTTPIISSGLLTISTSHTGTPTLLLQRQTATDTYKDWKIVNDGGVLTFKESASSKDSDNVKFWTAGISILATTSGTPTLELRRGTTSDTYVDWKIINDGALAIQRNASSTYIDSIRFEQGAIALITNDSGTPTIEFRRGTESDANVDNKIISNNGALQFVKSVSGTDTNLASIDSNGNFAVIGTVTGTNIPTYYTGTSDPTSSLGNDGYIYLKLSS